MAGRAGMRGADRGMQPIAGPIYRYNAATAVREHHRQPAHAKTWTAPVSSESSVLTFRQSIGATEALPMGQYSKTLTFTLTTTTPQPSPPASSASSGRVRAVSKEGLTPFR